MVTRYNTLEKKAENAERMRIYRKNNPITFKRIDLKKKYNLSLETYLEILKKQNNVCAVCEKEDWAIDHRTGKTRWLAVDHCHKTGKIRGLLCTACNRAIGLLKDDVALVQSALEYLNDHQA